MKLIDKDALVAEIERMLQDEYACETSQEETGYHCALHELKYFLNTLEVKEVIAEQECTCNEALNRIIGGSWNLLCPVNKLGLKIGDKVKVIIESQKEE